MLLGVNRVLREQDEKMEEMLSWVNQLDNMELSEDTPLAVEWLWDEFKKCAQNSYNQLNSKLEKLNVWLQKESTDIL